MNQIVDIPAVWEEIIKPFPTVFLPGIIGPGCYYRGDDGQYSDLGGEFWTIRHTFLLLVLCAEGESIC